MPLTLRVDGRGWRTHLRRVCDSHPGIVPVVKGNGYGFGVPRLAQEAARLGVDTVAVGRYDEVAPVASAFGGSVLVLSPWRPFQTGKDLEQHVVHSIGRPEDLRALSERAAARRERPRVVLERLTSMRRHGFSARGLREAATMLDGVEVEGVAVHLPIRRGSSLPEMDRLMTDVVAAGLPTKRVFVSHLTDAELESLRAAWPDYDLRPRIGTLLWLGDRASLQVRATVLDAHRVERGDAFGYRGRLAPAAGTILVVSGGTTNGIGLEAPTGGATLRDRVARVAIGGLDAVGWVRSPYTVDGKRRLFAEPPHMQVSMLFLRHGVRVPAVGEELPVRVRHTTTTFDETVVSD